MKTKAKTHRKKMGKTVAKKSAKHHSKRDHGRDLEKEYVVIFKFDTTQQNFEWRKEGDVFKTFSLFDEDQNANLSFHTTQLI